MAEKLGKSRSSITEALSLGAMPEEIRQLCRLADIQSKSVLLQVVRQGSPEKMTALVERLVREGATRVEARRLARKAEARRGRGRPRHFVFRYKAHGGAFSLNLQFKRAQVEPEEVLRALEDIVETLKRETNLK
jgi:ParB family chromosome partitioning protein